VVIAGLKEGVLDVWGAGFEGGWILSTRWIVKRDINGLLGRQVADPLVVLEVGT
jgi:hypothetical protein